MGTNIHGPVITLTPSLPATIKGEMAEGGDNCLRGGQEGTMVDGGDEVVVEVVLPFLPLSPSQDTCEYGKRRV